MAATVTKSLRDLISREPCIPLLSAYDALSARLLESAGFSVLHAGGYNVAAAHLGLPDVGYMTMTEMLGAVRNIVGSVGIPVIADGDDGYGNHLNVGRLIRELEKAGAAGVHIEDQVFPKRCGHMAGKGVIPAEDMVSKIKAAVDARTDADFVIIARTDAIAVHGFDDAIARGQAYADAGADIIFVEAPETPEHVAKVPQAITKPALFNWVYGGRSPTPSFEEAAGMGYKFVLCADVLAYVAKTLSNYYGEIRRTGQFPQSPERLFSFDEFNRIIGLDRVAELDRRFGR